MSFGAVLCLRFGIVSGDVTATKMARQQKVSHDEFRASGQLQRVYLGRQSVTLEEVNLLSAIAHCGFYRSLEVAGVVLVGLGYLSPLK